MRASPAAAELLRRVSPALVDLEMPGRRGTGFFLGGAGHLVTNLHVVVSAPSLKAHLAGGEVVSVTQVSGVDARRDLAVLKLEAHGHGALALSVPSPLGAEDVLFAVGCGADGRAHIQAAQVSAVQVVGDWLTVLELACDFPERCSGGPLLNALGEPVGVATVAQREGRPVTLGIPLRYLRPLLALPEAQSLAALGLSEGSWRGRAVPRHSLALLEDSSLLGLEMTALFLGESLELGDSASRRGDVSASVRIYLRTARQLLMLREDCPGVQQALREGMARAAALEDLGAKAWALRDCFEGLLAVVRRWFEAQAAITQLTPCPPGLN